MKRWHLTLLLALLAAGGAALAVPLRGVGRSDGPAPAAIPPEAPAVVSVTEVAPAEPPRPPVVLERLSEPPVPRPARPIHPRPMAVSEGVHPIHVDQGERGGAIPELSEVVRRPPVIAELPPDPPEPELPDGCPACGMG